MKRAALVLVVLDLVALAAFLDRLAAASVCEANCGRVNAGFTATLVVGIVLLGVTLIAALGFRRRRGTRPGSP
jgi:hypothetical protein